MEERLCTPCDCSPSDCCEKVAEKRPAATEMVMNHEKAREINISQVDYGYIIRVGCQTFCIEKLQVVLDMLNNYLKNPDSVEKMWRTGDLVISENIETISKKK